MQATTPGPRDDVADRAARLPESHPPAATDLETFLGAHFHLGLAWVHFPEGHGALGLGPDLQRAVAEALTTAGGDRSAKTPLPPAPLHWSRGVVPALE